MSLSSSKKLAELKNFRDIATHSPSPIVDIPLCVQLPGVDGCGHLLQDLTSLRVLDAPGGRTIGSDVGEGTCSVVAYLDTVAPIPKELPKDEKETS